jgi:hypothetical protein
MRTPSALLLTSLVLVFPIQAQVYKHIDNNGKVTYSSSPPIGGSSSVEVKVQKLSPEQEASAYEARARFLERERDRKERDEKIAATQKKECDRLLSRRSQLQLPGPFSVPIDDGRILVATGRAKVELLEHINASIREKCPNAP